MIEAVLADALGAPVRNRRILDIGCGNGGISRHFARENDHYGVDVSDRRHEDARDFAFRLVDCERLPFADNSFDIVISHHVIEHVFDQKLHLSEIRRVLKPSGLAYLATPNKSSPIMEGHVGNDLVLRYHAMAPLFERQGFEAREYATEVLREPDRYDGEIRWGRFLPRFLLQLLRPLFPSHVFVLTLQAQQEHTPSQTQEAGLLSHAN
ncbi:MAG: class I SAM-dependent methyltransferase [Kiloniellales bacterium]|nr:class I SAM-dependent methyltransferase [Kiloniellales bacterium]